MKKLSSILLISIFAILFGCTKDNPNDNGGGNSPTNNSAPTCSITTPQNGATFAYDENINVSIFAEDSDGTIAKVSLYIDEVGYSEMTAFPYNFTIPSGVMSPGQHTIKAIAKDNGGSNGESSIAITIEEPATESPDFVTFSDGQIPPTWQTASWHMDNTGGYDDIYSLKIVGEGSVMTTKTIQGNGQLEFYMKGGGDFYSYAYQGDHPSKKLYIDGAFSYSYKKQDVGSWTKYTVYLGPGCHTFLWEYSGDFCQIDAIRFTHNCSHRIIGEYYQGGYVGYLDSTREHGFIISENDLGTYNWEDANSACNNYSVGEYSDWRLPTSNEACYICDCIVRLRLFEVLPTNYYWTSSYYETGYLIIRPSQFLDHGEYYNISFVNPENVHNTRAIRSF